MARDYKVVLMTDTIDGDEDIHLPGTSCYHTLCGWCDVRGVESKLASEAGPVNCLNCLDVVRECRKYTRSMISQT